MQFSNEKNGYFLNLLKGCFFSCVFATVSVLLFSVVLCLFDLNQSAIEIINVIIRIMAVGVCVYFITGNKNGLLNGLIGGVSCAVCLFLLFAIMGKGFVFDKNFIVDTICEIVSGVIFAVIFVNLKR